MPRGFRNTLGLIIEQVEVRGAEECWPWLGAISKHGYGVTRLGGRQWRAHRLAYMKAFGVGPGQLGVLHRCDNRKCCNPSHLFLGTNGDNNRDCANKNRTKYGRRHPGAKLTEKKVRRIRSMAAAGASMTKLASEYGVTLQNIHYIVKRATWRRAK